MRRFTPHPWMESGPEIWRFGWRNRLNAIGAEEYEMTRLQKLFRNHPHMEELERELLHESVRQITYRGKGIQVQLKNGQIMKGGQQP